MHAAAPRLKRPAKELRGFQRITLEPKQKKTITFSLPAADLAYWDVKTKGFVVEPGTYDIMPGASSEDIRQSARLRVK